MPPTTILVVEDEKIIARGIEKRLTAMGYLVVALAATGEEAVRLADVYQPDVVLMDITLAGGMDGIEAAERVRAARDVPVVFLTAHSDPATLDRAKKTEPTGYVLKPFEDRDLQTAVEIGLYRHRMDARLKENERWLAATLGSIGDGVIATDETGRVRLLNVLAETLTGWPQADAAGRDIREVFRIVHERTRQPVPNPVTAALATGANTALAPDTVLIDRAGHEWPIEDSAAPIRDAAGKVVGAVLVFRDISERRRLEEHLRQAQKMEAIGRLAGGIAHDFNNIMTAITGYADLLLADALPESERPAALMTIHAAGQRAAGLTRQIMAFSRKQMLVPTVLDLNAVVRDMGDLVRRLIGSHIRFVTQPAADLGTVKADPSQLGQVILNLCVNARDAMRAGGTLTVATANAAVTAAHPDAGTVPPGRYVVLSVADTGVGMSEAVLAHLFEPFFTTKPVGEGTGLGLATVYGIVAQSGGRVAVSSRPGEGTEFRVYLPRVEADSDPPPSSRRVRTAAAGRETVLLVEDDDTVRQLTKTILERDGYTVLAAANGPAAVAALGQPSRRIHLLMTDLVMPGMPGRLVAERVSAVVPGVRVLYMSGYTEDEIVHQGVESAGTDFLHKPFTVDGLLGKVREVLDRA